MIVQGEGKKLKGWLGNGENHLLDFTGAMLACSGHFPWSCQT